MTSFSLFDPGRLLSINDLDPIEQLLLVAIARATRFSTNAHCSEEVILRYFPVKNGGRMLKAARSRGFKRLTAKGLITKHPTRGTMTWNITIDGVKLAKTVLGKPEIRE